MYKKIIFGILILLLLIPSVSAGKIKLTESDLILNGWYEDITIQKDGSALVDTCLTFGHKDIFNRPQTISFEFRPLEYKVPDLKVEMACAGEGGRSVCSKTCDIPLKSKIDPIDERGKSDYAVNIYLPNYEEASMSQYYEVYLTYEIPEFTQKNLLREYFMFKVQMKCEDSHISTDICPESGSMQKRVALPHNNTRIEGLTAFNFGPPTYVFEGDTQGNLSYKEIWYQDLDTNTWKNPLFFLFLSMFFGGIIAFKEKLKKILNFKKLLLILVKYTFSMTDPEVVQQSALIIAIATVGAFMSYWITIIVDLPFYFAIPLLILAMGFAFFATLWFLGHIKKPKVNKENH